MFHLLTQDWPTEYVLVCTCSDSTSMCGLKAVCRLLSQIANDGWRLAGNKPGVFLQAWRLRHQDGSVGRRKPGDVL